MWEGQVKFKSSNTSSIVFLCLELSQNGSSVKGSAYLNLNKVYDITGNFSNNRANLSFTSNSSKFSANFSLTNNNLLASYNRGYYLYASFTKSPKASCIDKNQVKTLQDIVGTFFAVTNSSQMALMIGLFSPSVNKVNVNVNGKAKGFDMVGLKYPGGYTFTGVSYNSSGNVSEVIIFDSVNATKASLYGTASPKCAYSTNASNQTLNVKKGSLFFCNTNNGSGFRAYFADFTVSLNDSNVPAIFGPCGGTVSLLISNQTLKGALVEPINGSCF